MLAALLWWFRRPGPRVHRAPLDAGDERLCAGTHWRLSGAALSLTAPEAFEPSRAFPAFALIVSAAVLGRRCRRILGRARALRAVSAAALAVTRRDRISLVGQWRHPPRPALAGACCSGGLRGRQRFRLLSSRVEQHWFAGPSTCSGAATAADTVEAWKAQVLDQHPVRCDEVAWSLSGRLARRLEPAGVAGDPWLLPCRVFAGAAAAAASGLARRNL